MLRHVTRGTKKINLKHFSHFLIITIRNYNVIIVVTEIVWSAILDPIDNPLQKWVIF